MLVLLMQSLASDSALSLEDPRSWVEFLKAAGGWGVAVVEGYVIWKLYSTTREDLKAKDDKIVTVLEKYNEVFKSMKEG